jgi:uncharacterized RDD family membrane protein YckC
MEALDQPLIANDTSVKYGGIGARFGATIVDMLVLTPVTLGTMYFNVTTWKSSLILVAVSLLTVAYKPWMELQYGATVGKMALKLKIVNLRYEQANINEILLRNIFNIVPSLIMLFITLRIYNDPDFQTITGFAEYSAWSAKFQALQFGNLIVGGIGIIDGIVLIADKQSRALHDKIASTFVIERA